MVNFCVCLTNFVILTIVVVANSCWSCHYHCWEVEFCCTGRFLI